MNFDPIRFSYPTPVQALRNEVNCAPVYVIDRRTQEERRAYIDKPSGLFKTFRGELLGTADVSHWRRAWKSTMNESPMWNAWHPVRDRHPHDVESFGDSIH